MSTKERGPKDPLLYRDIQRAYEHIRSVVGNVVHGDAGDFLTRLYEQRLRSVLLGEPMAPREGQTYEGFQHWFREARSARQGDVVAGTLDEIWVGDDTPDLFREEGERLRREFDADRRSIGDLGLDCYAAYLPIHFFFGGNRSDTDWGIYISESGVMRLAAVLEFGFRRVCGPVPEDKASRFVSLAYQVLLRHELEHFKIESFALNAEMFMQKAVYVPYLLHIYTQLYYYEECLEEALANATVLNSRVIKDMVRDMYGAGPEILKATPPWQYAISSHFFDLQFGGYRNYDLRCGFPGADRGRWAVGRGEDSAYRQAMNYLCNQMIDGSPKPATQVPFYAFPPDNFFLRAENLVPIHVVRSIPPEKSFLQLATPTRGIWERFLGELDFYPDGRGKGDHDVWRSANPKWQDVTLNYHGKELDLNSYRSTLRTLKINTRDFAYYRSTGRLPEKLVAQMQPA